MKQQFNVGEPNQVWVSDVTYFRYKDKRYYICVIIDLFSRKVVAHNTSLSNSTRLVNKTFLSAWATRTPQETLVFHSDQGTQHTFHSFHALLKERKVLQSFSNPGKPHDVADIIGLS